MGNWLPRSIVMVAFTTAVFLGGCESCSNLFAIFFEPDADITNPNTHTNALYEFQYPGNWKVAVDGDNEDDMKTEYVTVESAGNAIFMFTIFHADIPLDVETYNKNMLETYPAMIGESMGGIASVDIKQTKPTQVDFAGETRPGLKTDVDITVLNEKVPHMLNTVLAKFPGFVIVGFSSLAKEDRGNVQPGYDLVLKSFKMKLPATAKPAEPKMPQAGTEPEPPTPTTAP